MKTVNQIRRNFNLLKGRYRYLDGLVRVVWQTIYFFIDVLLLPIGWIMSAAVWASRTWHDLPLPNDLELEKHLFTHLDLNADVRSRFHVSTNALEEVVQHGLRAFGEHDIDAESRRRMIRTFSSACPDALMFLVVRDGEVFRKVGYTSILSLRKSAYIAYRRGELRDYDFNERHIIQPGFSKQQLFLCLQAFALNSRINRETAKMLYEGLAYHLSWYIPDLLDSRPILIAEAATRQGERLLERFSFAKIGDSANGVPLYELDARQYEILPARARRTLEVVDSLVRQFACLPSAN